MEDLCLAVVEVIGHIAIMSVVCMNRAAFFCVEKVENNRKEQPADNLSNRTKLDICGSTRPGMLEVLHHSKMTTVRPGGDLTTVHLGYQGVVALLGIVRLKTIFSVLCF